MSGTVTIIIGVVLFHRANVSGILSVAPAYTNAAFLNSDGVVFIIGSVLINIDAVAG